MNIGDAFQTIVCEILKKPTSDESDAETRKKGRKGGCGECAVLSTKRTT